MTKQIWRGRGRPLNSMHSYKDGRIPESARRARDETGSMKMSLWNQQIDTVHKGDVIDVKNGEAGSAVKGNCDWGEAEA